LIDLDLNLTGFDCKTDEELAVMAKHDKSAASALAERYSDLVFIKSEIFADSKSDKDDLRQEGLMSLLKAMEAFDPERGVKFSTFAEVCIVNRMRSVSAKTRKAAAFPESIEYSEMEEVIADDKTPESIFIYKEFFTDLWNNIETALSKTEMRVFTLSVDGMSYREIAEKLGISEKSVDNAMQRARRKIKTLISE